MKISLSDHFSCGRLLRFTLPSIAMMIFSSIYGVVDGYFVSNFAGKAEFTAVNFIMPYLMILGSFGFMFGAGGSALVAKRLGEGRGDDAKSLFSLVVYTTFAVGVLLAIFGIAFLEPAARLLGADGIMLEQSIRYGKIILAALPFFMLQMEFQTFMITAERPNLGFVITLASGFTNIVLDALLVAVLDLSLEGAAVATALSQAVGGILPVLFFVLTRTANLRLGRTRFEGAALLKVATNGSSELLGNISMSIVGMLYNAQLLKWAGEDGVAAYGVLMYVSMIFAAIFIGFSVGVAPVLSFHYGAGNKTELRSILKRSNLIISVCSVFMLVLALVLARPLSALFVGYDRGLYELTVKGFGIYAFSFLFCGFAIYLSSFFTALNDGLTSALISFLRTIVFQVAAILILPALIGVDGIWLSITAAELAAAIIAFAFLFIKKNKYGYM
ncbi:MAG: MATE family efflux transporter [Clostridia bacterium]|nr:MATE family efflux transporter [Clostridia bacterium]